MVAGVGTGGCNLKIVEPSLALAKARSGAERNQGRRVCMREGEIGDHNVAISNFRNGKFVRCYANAGNRSDRFP
jgi:hypothetical protein